MAEDEAAVAALLQELLEQAGHQVTLAGSGDEAITLLRDHGPFDLLITDAVMPGHYQGVDIIEFAHATAPDTAVLLISGYAEGTLDKAERYPMLTKPVPAAELLQTVSLLLSNHAAPVVRDRAS
ncbi:MAG: response regulator [Pseudomonadota bacterium]